MICGFLFSYLWTRLFLPGAFRQADLSALVTIQVSQVKRDFERQGERDAAALSLTQRQLNPSLDGSVVSPTDLMAAISASSPMVKVQIFNLAQNLRSQNWRFDKPKMELTIEREQVISSWPKCNNIKLDSLP